MSAISFNKFREVIGQVFDAANVALRVNIVADQSQVLKIYGSVSTPVNVVAGTGVVYGASYHQQLWYIQGSGGAVTISANPQIANGNTDGDTLELRGCSDSQTVKIQDGTGLSLNGPFTIANYDSITLRWDTQKWVEISRRENA